MRAFAHSIRVGFALLAATLAGCSAFPDVVHQPQFHNPFPQLYRVAILPFYNQSDDPHVNQDEVALAYYQELQQIPGFEVMPVGTAKRLLQAAQFEPQTAADFQKLAQLMGVDALIVGSITEYSPYYPPRIGLSVNWYAANPGFHPIPAGYGLPWGTTEEEYIPNSLIFEAEFALAREQLKTQTPDVPAELQPTWPTTSPHAPSQDSQMPADEPATDRNDSSIKKIYPGRQVSQLKTLAGAPSDGPDLPNAPHLAHDWPDPRGFIPPPPLAEKPPFTQHVGPIISHTRLYDGHNADFTEALANYFYFRDDARFGGWEGYLQRSEDFIRFCCYLHVTETLAARGGAGETRVVWRWPIGRYER